MIYHLLYPLHEYIFAFNVLRYITFRTAMAILTALCIHLVLGHSVIARLKALQIGQQMREEGPSSHYKKTGTPTMGGLLILLAVLTSSLLWVDLTSKFFWLVFFSTLAFAGIGLADDCLKHVYKRSLGLRVREKLPLQILVGLVIGGILYYLASQNAFTTELSFPFFKGLRPELGIFYVPFVALVLVSAANAVNLTDGLDGLAIGSVFIAASTYLVLAYVVGHAVIADYLQIVNVQQSGELTIFCGALVGASLGFLWYNAHPADIFMGDVGSLSLGGAIGTIAVIIKQELLLVVVGGLFVIEALSVILQVCSYKMFGERVFRMAPLHHHYELKGLAESKIVIRFLIVAVIFALLSLSTLKLR